MGRRWKRLVGQAKWYMKPGRTQPESGTRNTGQRGQKPNRSQKSTPGQKEKETESIFFIPYTPGSTLKQKLTEMEEKLDYPTKVRFVEKLGQTLAESLMGGTGKGHCGRVNCFPCRSGHEGQCTNQNVTYEITCQICLKAGKTSQYIGESARTAFDRGGNHLADLRAYRTKNPLVKHLAEDHPGESWDNFKMKVTRTHKNPMYRCTDDL